MSEFVLSLTMPQLKCYLCEETLVNSMIPVQLESTPIFCNWDCFDAKVNELFKAELVRKMGQD